jgi:hypothetical protein
LKIMAGNRGRLTFKETEVRRAIRAVQAMGLPISKVEIGKDGKIAILSMQEVAPAESAFEAWKGKRHARAAQRD